MKKLHYAIDIRAPREKVWQILWNDDTYRQWTSVFSEGSHAISDWQEGSRVHFLDGKGGGMFSEIIRMEPNARMTFRHLGEIKDGVEQPADEKTAEWAGSLEDYTLTPVGDGTRLVIDLDGQNDWLDYFNTTFPKALEKIKALAEQ